MDSKRIAAARPRVYILVTTTAALLGTVSATGLIPQYTAAEARKHIGETATVVGKVDCIDHGRRHVDLIVGGCDLRKALLWIVLPDEASGPELDPETVRGVQIAVTGKIESAGGTPQITIKSTTQIQPRTALQINYIGRAYDKEQQGNIDGAIADLDKAIAHQPARRDEACQHLAKLKEQKGDWPGALAAYERLIGFDPNNSSSYYVRATAKKQHGDFEAAMADFTRAAELRSDPAGFTSIGDMRKERGDIAGANAEYDKAIALCDRQIAGTAKTDSASPLGSDPYFSRGYARELKGDLDEAVADYTQAIANNPARAAMAYGARGNIRRARGDLGGAIADYQHKYQITHYPDDKQKLEQARAEAKAGAKKVVVAPTRIQAAQNEQSSNKGEVTPESVAEAFVEAYSGTDVDAVAGLYGDRIDYTNSGVIGRADIRKQAREYFARWPKRQWSLTGPVKTTSMGPSRQKVIFSASYDASNPKANIHASGVAQETLILATDQTGGIKIVSQKERTSKRDSSQPDEKTSGDFGLKAAKTEYDTSSRDEAARIRYVTKLAGMLGKGMQYWWRTHDKMGGPNLDGVEEELIKHPMPRNVDSRKLTPLLIGKWASPRHVYVFRADGTYGVADEQRDKWRIDRNEYIDDVSRGPIILLDRNYFIYAEGEGVAFYMRANDSEAERNQSANTNTQNAAEEVNSTFNGAGDKADGEEKLFSPDKSYSVEIMRGYGLNSSALVLFNGTQELARIPAEVGPVGSFFEALWSPDGKYVAINKQRSSRPGGDEMWIVALPTGKVLRQPDDAPWDELYEKADAFIAEKGLNETGGKEFLTLIAISWEKDRLRLRLEAGFSETEDRYFFEGTVDPLHLKTIADWKVSKTKS
jgi:tetratricopeptide (TPR) repeat protein